MRILGFKKKMSNIFNCTISGVVVSVLIIITASSPSSGSQTVSDECVWVSCSYDVWEVLFLSKSLILTRHIQITGHRQQNCHKEYCPVSAMYGEIADCCNLLFDCIRNPWICDVERNVWNVCQLWGRCHAADAGSKKIGRNLHFLSLVWWSNFFLHIINS